MSTRYWTRDYFRIAGAGHYPLNVDGAVQLGESTPSTFNNDTVVRVLLDVAGSTTLINPGSPPIDGWWSRMPAAIAVGAYEQVDPTWPIGLGIDEAPIILTSNLFTTFDPGIYSTKTGSLTWQNTEVLESKGQRTFPTSTSPIVVRVSMLIDNIFDGVGGAPHPDNSHIFTGYLRVLWESH
jgi:hypothetical protein